MNSKVAVTKCKSYESLLVYAAVKRSVDLVGGITAFVKPGTKVLVKPNLLLATEPESAVDTHPEVVRAAVKILKEIDCKVYIGDGPNVWGDQALDIDKVFEKSGMKRIADEEAVELVKFDKRRWRRDFILTTWCDECESLVSVPKFKTHGLTLLTGAIKNPFGLVPGTYKTELHKKYTAIEDFARILVDIYAEAHPALTIIDGIVAMEGDGPGTRGKPRETGLIFAGADGVAIDAILALVMGLAPGLVATTKEAAKRGLGVEDIQAIDLLGEKLADIIGKPFILPQASIVKKIPRPVIEFAKKVIRFYPKVDYNKCCACGSCVKACPSNGVSLGAKRISINYAKCISCFCCQEACPAAAIKVAKSVIAKIMGL